MAALADTAALAAPGQWTVETAVGTTVVITASDSLDYTRLMLTLPSEVMLPVTPLLYDVSMGTLSFLVPAETAHWLEAALIGCADAEDASLEAADGFAVAGVGIVTDSGCMPMFSVAPPGIGWTRLGRWPHGAAARHVACDAGRNPPPEGHEAARDT